MQSSGKFEYARDQGEERHRQVQPWCSTLLQDPHWPPLSTQLNRIVREITKSETTLGRKDLLEKLKQKVTNKRLHNISQSIGDITACGNLLPYPLNRATTTLPLLQVGTCRQGVYRFYFLDLVGVPTNSLEEEIQKLRQQQKDTVSYHGSAVPRPERRSVCGLGVSGTPYSWEHLLDDKCEEIILVGQNLRTQLGPTEFRKRIVDILEANDKTQVYFIGTLYECMKVLTHECAKHFDDTLRDLRKLYESLKDKESRDRLHVRFHRSACMLSALIVDPSITERAILVIWPKWGLDAEPGNRLYVVFRKSEHPDEFGKIAGHVPRMLQLDEDARTLSGICKDIKKEIEEGRKIETDGILPTLEWFIEKGW